MQQPAITALAFSRPARRGRQSPAFLSNQSISAPTSTTPESRFLLLCSAPMLSMLCPSPAPGPEAVPALDHSGTGQTSAIPVSKPGLTVSVLGRVFSFLSSRTVDVRYGQSSPVLPYIPRQLCLLPSPRIYQNSAGRCCQTDLWSPRGERA